MPHTQLLGKHISHPEPNEQSILGARLNFLRSDCEHGAHIKQKSIERDAIYNLGSSNLQVQVSVGIENIARGVLQAFL
ncbi:hypothetical protein S1OALGB6SA_1675, partial [Olavius algarvensis spirochete endosymbiont]